MGAMHACCVNTQTHQTQQRSMHGTHSMPMPSQCQDPLFAHPLFPVGAKSWNSLVQNLNRLGTWPALTPAGVASCQWLNMIWVAILSLFEYVTQSVCVEYGSMKYHDLFTTCIPVSTREIDSVQSVLPTKSAAEHQSQIHPSGHLQKH